MSAEQIRLKAPSGLKCWSLAMGRWWAAGQYLGVALASSWLGAEPWHSMASAQPAKLGLDPLTLLI